MTFSKISSIRPEQKNTWQDRLFITIDIDWAHDEVILELMNTLSASNVSATFFATHDTPVLTEIARNPLFELGIHPNFDFLLNGTAPAESTMETVVTKCLDFAPNATSVRSHSLTQGSKLTAIFEKYGLTHECNTLLPYTAFSDLSPWFHCGDKSIRVPHFWEDDVHVAYGWDWKDRPEEKTKGLNVFDFHPIHAFLNTDTLQLYEDTRNFHQNPSALKKLINKKNLGVKNFLDDLIEKHKPTSDKKD
jgi:hypothetical protein